MIKEKIVDFIKELDRPIMDKELKDIFNISKNDSEEFQKILDELVDTGILLATKKKKYGTPEMFSMLVGRVQVTQKGFGFFICDDIDVSDVFIPPSELNSAMDGDRVFIKITKTKEEGKRQEGTIVKIIERKTIDVVGTFQLSKTFGFVVPDNKRINSDIFIPYGKTGNAKTDDKVVARITKYQEGDKKPEGKVIEVLGNKNEVGIDILSVIKKFELPEGFPKKVLGAAAEIPTEVDEEEITNRRDLRSETIVTIDGSDAKDLDDAVNVTKLANGNFKLGVHIADVSYYVTERSDLDKEALKRATSVYLIDRVIPMLPERLSNGICSLNPHVNRLTMSCEMEIDQNGAVVNHDIFESVIRTSERMTYTDVSEILEGNLTDELNEKYEYLIAMFKDMEELCKILRARRENRGAIDFNFPEPQIILDEEGTPVDIIRRERRIANRVIEEFMLIANETVAEHFHYLEVPFVYRVHELPTEEKITNFNKFIHNLGYNIKGSLEEVHPKAIQKLLEEVKGEKEEAVISKLMLRSLKQAKYTPLNEGHFGLAADYYSHFTSPIRRYPDLQIHRIIREHIQGKLTPARIEKLKYIVEESSKQASERERIAEKAERDVDDMKMAEYALQFIGEEFEGMISSVTGFGMFIELENTMEGLVRISELKDDYYIYEEEKLRLVGERTKNVYSVGDSVKIVIVGANVDQREIDFVILEKIED